LARVNASSSAARASSACARYGGDDFTGDAKVAGGPLDAMTCLSVGLAYFL
jgi:hypothetical protein